MPSSALDIVWAKSDTNGDGPRGSSAGLRRNPQRHRILAHMLDTAEVAGVLWDRWLAHSVRARFDLLGAGQLSGRDLVRWVAGVHDLGKISPAFQIKAPELAAALHAEAGLPVCRDTPEARAWHHTLAGGAALVTLLQPTPWREHRHWLAGIVGGHHGVYPTRGDYLLRPPGEDEGDRDYVVRPNQSAVHGDGSWEDLRREALTDLTHELGVADDLASLPPISAPSHADQVILTGLVIMADWIASSGEVMPGIWGEDRESAESSRRRALAAWDSLRLNRGWDRDLPLADGRNVFLDRFGARALTPRDTQVVTERAAKEIPAPGLLIVEAPMGEGKTEAALVAAEVLASRFGQDGLFIGLPTQATSDAMFDRVADWLGAHWQGSSLALAHGKKVVNKTLRQMPQWTSTGVGIDCEHEHSVMAPSQWFEGSKRTLLSPYVVGTIDNLLLAGAAIRHLPLYHLALAGKVVVLDEVHAVDIYMGLFLQRALSWLGAAEVPVVLLSATLPEPQRRQLIAAYTGRDPAAVLIADRDCYPRITTAIPGPDGTETVYEATSGRNPMTVEVRVVNEPAQLGGSTGTADPEVIDLLDERLSDGGCALIVRNTVGRAQSLYEAVREHYGADAEVALLHARFTAGHRAAHTDAALAKLGSPDSGANRPHRYVLVATQVAEQSLDIDADILITDLCPVDLMLQRVGRMHRHAANDRLRPVKLRTPQLYVTRMSDDPANGSGLPERDPWHAFVYPLALLARTAQAVHRHNGCTIAVPNDIPALVAEVYDPQCHRLDRPSWESEFTRYDAEHLARQAAAQTRATNIAIPDARCVHTIDGLNRVNAGDDDPLRIMVRDGDISVEAVLLRRTATGLETVGAESELAMPESGDISRGGSDGKEAAAQIMASTIRIPASALTSAVLGLLPLPAWARNPWVKDAHALVLSEDLTTTLTDAKGRQIEVSYSSAAGLTARSQP